jgi:hypothetical protein
MASKPVPCMATRDKSQEERDWVLNEFKSCQATLLVATDIAAMGLDVDDIRMVVNLIHTFIVLAVLAELARRVLPCRSLSSRRTDAWPGRSLKFSAELSRLFLLSFMLQFRQVVVVVEVDVMRFSCVLNDIFFMKPH